MKPGEKHKTLALALRMLVVTLNRNVFNSPAVGHIFRLFVPGTVVVLHVETRAVLEVVAMPGDKVGREEGVCDFGVAIFAHGPVEGDVEVDAVEDEGLWPCAELDEGLYGGSDGL